MPIRNTDNLICLDGHCPIDEAEALFEVLRTIEAPVFDLAQTASLHTAIIQLMIASAGKVRNVPDDPVLSSCFRAAVAA